MPALPNVGLLPDGQDLAWIALGLMLLACLHKLWRNRTQSHQESGQTNPRATTGKQTQHWWRVLGGRLYAAVALPLLICLVATLRLPLSLAEPLTAQAYQTPSITLGWGDLQLASLHCSKLSQSTSYQSQGNAQQHPLCPLPGWITRDLTPYHSDLTQAPTVFEDGVGLWGRRASQRLTQDRGAGRFHLPDSNQRGPSIWYSASDNSLPSTNGRRYQLRTPANLALWVQLLGWCFCLPLLVGFYQRIRPVLERGSPGQTTPSLAAQLALFGLLGLLCLEPLWLLWGDAGSRFAIAGLLPWSDGSDWFNGLNHLLSFNALDSWTVRRPLNPVFLAGLYHLADLDWPTTLVLRALLLALSLGFLCRVMLHRFGWLPTLAAAGLAAAFAQDFIPVALTEVQGLIFAVVGFAWLVLGVSQQRLAYYLAGVCLVSIALTLRLGPVGLLGAFVLWPLVGVDPLQRWRWVRWSALAAGLGLCPTLLWTTLAYSGDNLPGANFAYTFYGLAYGGGPWTLFGEHYPQLADLKDAEVTRVVWQQALAQVQAQPGMLLQGFAAFTGNYFQYFFVFLDQPLKPVLIGLFGLGLIRACFGLRGQHQDPMASFALLSWLGVLATTPIIYWSLDAYRAFAVSIPLDMLLVAAGGRLLLQLPRLKVQQESSTLGPETKGWAALSLLLLLSLSLLPWLAMEQRQPPATDNLVFLELPGQPTVAESQRPVHECPQTQRSVLLDIGRSSPWIQLSTNPTAQTWLTRVNLQAFRYDPSFYHSPIAQQLGALQAGDRLIHGFDYLAPSEATGLWVQLPYPLALTAKDEIRGLHQLCVEPWDSSEASTRYRLYRATRFAKVL